MQSEQLGLELGIYERQLRWYSAEGKLVPLPEEAEHQQAEQERERAEQAHQQTEQERERAERERIRAERLEGYLRSQGIDPNNLPNL